MSRRVAAVDYSMIDVIESDSSETELSRPTKTNRRENAPAKNARDNQAKHAISSGKSAREESSLDTDTAPVKRGRGRPRKQAVSEKVAEDDSQVVQLAEETEQPTLEPTAPNPPKKRRGRPKLNANAAEEPKDGQLEAAEVEVEVEVAPESQPDNPELLTQKARPGRKPKATTTDRTAPPASQESDGRKVRIFEPGDSETGSKKRGRRKNNETEAELAADSTVEAKELAENSMDATGEGAEQSAREGRTTPPASPRVSTKRGRKADRSNQADAPEGGSTSKRKRDYDFGDGDEDESDGTPVLRRKLYHARKDLEMLQARYTKLKDVGIKEADAKFDELKEEMLSREKTQQKAADDVISALKADLAAAKKEVAEASKLQAKLEKAEEKWRNSQNGTDKFKEKATTAEAENKTLRAKAAAAEAETKTMRTKMAKAEAETSAIREKIADAEAENKTIRAKLTAARKAAVEVPAANGRAVESAAAKGKGKAIVDPKAAAQAAIATLKEDLYSDLTGMIIRDVDQAEAGDVFDCIQTGRNGTLHFLLAIDKTDPAASYEDTKFHYKPLIDEWRDKELLQIIPEYFGEEIEFPRAKAAGFFKRIWDPLTRKLD